jgi:hypothetical protein
MSYRNVSPGPLLHCLANRDALYRQLMVIQGEFGGAGMLGGAARMA